MTFPRTIAAAALASASVVCFAQQAQIQLSAFPSMSVADGRSTTTISATVRDSRGNLIPDGTRIVFDSTMGNFRETIVATANGVARAVLQAGGIPGTATITVKTVDIVATPSTMQFEFKGDRSMLDSAMQYIEVVSPKYMEFVPDNRIMAAAAPDKGVYIRYRDITITADDVQINIPRYEVRARRATLKIGKLTQDFDELYIKLNDGTGIGSTMFKGLEPCPISFVGTIPIFLTDEPARIKSIGKLVDRYGLVDINHDTITPSKTVANASRMAFEDASAFTSSITAKKAIIFPQREIQFQRATILVTGNKVMQLPLYELNLMQINNNSVMGDMLNVNDNQVEVNYPYYLSLKPGMTSLLRFRTGEQYGRGVGGSGGAFLDYELDWNRGDSMDGKFIFSGIGRNDWGAGIQQYLKFDERTSAFADLEMPANEGIYGSLNLSRTFDGFQTSLSGSVSRSLRGIDYTSQDYSFVAEKDPTKIGKLPVRLYYGVTAQQDSNSLVGSSQSAVGVRARLASQPINLSPRTTLYAGLSVAHLSGQNTLNGLTTTAETTIRQQLNSRTSVQASYNFIHDGYSERYLGEHRIDMEAHYDTQRFNFSVLASRSLDLDRMSLYGDMSLNVMGNWWIRSGYTLDKYLGIDYLDYTFGLGYRISGREIGVVWSRSTNRIGLELLGASF